jgi:hypothetical protein
MIEPDRRTVAATFAAFLLIGGLAVRPGIAFDAPSPANRGDPRRWRTFEGDGGLVGFKDARGNVVVPPRFLAADSFTADGLAGVRIDGAHGWTYIDRSGRVLVPETVTTDPLPDPFVEGLARFIDGGKVGFFDRRGRIVVPARYDYAFPMEHGLGVFCLGCEKRFEGEIYFLVGGRWGLVDRRGVEVVPPIYDEILANGDGSGFRARSGAAVVRLDRHGKARTAADQGAAAPSASPRRKAR